MLRTRLCAESLSTLALFTRTCLRYNYFLSLQQLEGDFDDYRKELLESLGETINSPSIIANAAVQQ